VDTSGRLRKALSAGSHKRRGASRAGKSKSVGRPDRLLRHSSTIREIGRRPLAKLKKRTEASSISCTSTGEDRPKKALKLTPLPETRGFGTRDPTGGRAWHLLWID